MIELVNVSKKFDRHPALEGVSLSIGKGSIFGLIGSNGAGKTTLMKLLAGIYLQDGGSVLVDGEPVFENLPLKEKLVFIPDQPVFFSQYTTKQMAKFYSSVYPRWNEERFLELTLSFKLDIDKKIHTFSKGWQRQIAFILALSANPDLLILDEPMDGLDPVVRQKVKNLLIQDVAAREMTILISSHNLREIEDLCDHIGILHNGKVLIQKELDELKSDVHKVQVAYRGEVPEHLEDKFDILHHEKRGSVLLFIIRGQEEEVEKAFRLTKPVLLDLLPLTLEEIFIYEMGDIGYAIKNILGK